MKKYEGLVPGINLMTMESKDVKPISLYTIVGVSDEYGVAIYDYNEAPVPNALTIRGIGVATIQEHDGDISSVIMVPDIILKNDKMDESSYLIVRLLREIIKESGKLDKQYRVRSVTTSTESSAVNTTKINGALNLLEILMEERSNTSFNPSEGYWDHKDRQIGLIGNMVISMIERMAQGGSIFPELSFLDIDKYICGRSFILQTYIKHLLDSKFLYKQSNLFGLK